MPDAGMRPPAGATRRPPGRPPAPLTPPSRRSNSRASGIDASPGASRAPGDIQGSFKFLKEDRSPGRATALIVAGVVVGVVLIVLLISSITGGGASKHNSSSTSGSPTAENTSQTTSTNPGAVSVSVLNGTETTGLAHKLATQLKQGGYSHANPVGGGHPPGVFPYPTTVVEYAGGHEAEAKHVARTLGVSSSYVRSLDSATQSLVHGASVVVVAGSDQAAGGSEEGAGSGTGP
jgi:LytR cell envelope-related transcriptional attenuator